MFLGIKLTFGLKVLLTLLVLGLGVWLILEWRKYQRYKQLQRVFAEQMQASVMAARSASKDMAFTKTPLRDDEYRARRELLSKRD